MQKCNHTTGLGGGAEQDSLDPSPAVPKAGAQGVGGQVRTRRHGRSDAEQEGGREGDIREQTERQKSQIPCVCVFAPRPC